MAWSAAVEVPELSNGVEACHAAAMEIRFGIVKATPGARRGGGGRARLGAGGVPADAAVHLAGRPGLCNMAETTPSTFEASWRANCYAPFLVARTFAPPMITRGQGAMVFFGATSSWRGSARTSAFSSGKQALRGLAQSLAKELGPHGVHVAHLVIDGKIAGARTVARFPEAKLEDCLSPQAVASTVVALLEQPRSAWTFELDLRPDRERW